VIFSSCINCLLLKWDTTGDKAKLEWLLNPVIRSTADLMISQELRKVKKCSDPVCGWLFLDISEMNYQQPYPNPDKPEK